MRRNELNKSVTEKRITSAALLENSFPNVFCQGVFWSHMRARGWSGIMRKKYKIICSTKLSFSNFSGPWISTFDRHLEEFGVQAHLENLVRCLLKYSTFQSSLKITLTTLWQSSPYVALLYKRDRKKKKKTIQRIAIRFILFSYSEISATGHRKIYLRTAKRVIQAPGP